MDASPDSLYVHPAGALSPSLWDDDWWEKPDAFKNLNSAVNDELPLGSPASPFPTSSLDASCFPNDDALNWMEKSCDLESLTELHDVSVQDVDQMPVQDLKQPPSQMEHSKFNPTALKNQNGISNNLFNVEGLEDLFHDYIDPQVYNKVKDERRVSFDSVISIDDVEDSVFLPVTEPKADLDIAAAFNRAEDCYNEDSKPVQAPAFIEVVPQPQYQYILPKPLKDDTKLLKLIPAGSQKPVLVQPIFVGTHNVSLQMDSGSSPNKVQGQVLQVAGNVKKDPTNARPIVQVPISGRINKAPSLPYARPPVSKNQVMEAVPKSISIQNFLGSLKKAENLIPLNALLQESNDLIKSSVDVKPSPPVAEQIVITCDPSVMESQVEIISEDNATVISSYDEAVIADAALCSPSMVQASPQASDISVESPREIEGKFDDSPTYTVSFDGSPSPSSVFEADGSPIVSFDECLSPGPSYGGALSSSSYSEVDQEWSPSMMKAANRGRRKITTTEERKSRKKVQNKEAAIRYRQKKRDEFGVFVQEENEQLEKNKQLKNKCSEIVTEMKYLKGLLRDLYKAKGLIN